MKSIIAVFNITMFRVKPMSSHIRHNSNTVKDSHKEIKTRWPHSFVALNFKPQAYAFMFMPRSPVCISNICKLSIVGNQISIQGLASCCRRGKVSPPTILLSLSSCSAPSFCIISQQVYDSHTHGNSQQTL